jgi:DNA-binding transcriptional MerR regulator
VDKVADAFRTISEVADDLDVPQHVLRFWETRFAQIKPMKRSGGRRYYRPDDVELLRGIRFLLYDKGFTIKGVQRILREEGIRRVQTVWRPDAAPPGDMARDAEDADDEAPVHEEPAGQDAAPPQAQVPVARPSAPHPAPAAHDVRLPAPPAVRPLLDAERERALHAALAELVECRRLIANALGESGASDPY